VQERLEIQCAIYQSAIVLKGHTFVRVARKARKQAVHSPFFLVFFRETPLHTWMLYTYLVLVSILPSRVDEMSLSGLQLSELCVPCGVKVESNVHLVKAQGGPWLFNDLSRLSNRVSTGWPTWAWPDTCGGKPIADNTTQYNTTNRHGWMGSPCIDAQLYISICPMCVLSTCIYLMSTPWLTGERRERGGREKLNKHNEID